jgi:ribosomal protein S18 acetylase RimI-like enzyme
LPGWNPLPFGQWEELAAFLLQEEWRHLHFSSRIKTALTKKALLPVREQCLVLTDSNSKILSACAVTPSGILLPAFTERPGPEETDGLKPWLRNRPLFSIVGTAERVDLLKRLLGSPARAINDYLMMTGPDADITEKAHPDVVIRRAVSADLDRLLPLETAYQKEEVLLSPSEAEPWFIRQNLAGQIKEQAVFLAERGGAIVAKGGTNAVGFGCIQLGGVYTRPEYRCQGLARTLVSHIVQWGANLGFRSALFVKPGNSPAVGLYRDLGFMVREDFKILYYR